MNVYECWQCIELESTGLLSPNECAESVIPPGVLKDRTKYVDGDIQRASTEFMLRYRGKAENAGIYK